MLRFLLICLTICLSQPPLFAQSDDCSSATPINVDPNCSSPVSGTTSGATQTIAGCSGNADDDVWYEFTATNTAHAITVTPSAGMDAVVQLFSGSCSSLISEMCKDSYGTGVAEVLTFSNLTVGASYKIRVYEYAAGSGSGSFTICVRDVATPPSNNDCSNAISLNVTSSCVPTSGTTVGATPASFAGCAGNPDDDVWYQFIATDAVQTVTTSTSDGIDLVMNIYSGTCSTLNTLNCVDNTLSGGTESVQLVGLTVGATYYIRIYDYYQGNAGTFNVCVTSTPTPIPSNDEPCNAIQIPPVTSACSYMEFTNVGATASMGAPTPASCVGGSGAQIGGFNPSTADVWFAIVIPASGNICITNKPNMGAGSIGDGVMALYSGSCNSLTQIACSDDNNYPGSGNDSKPMINADGLTPGSTVYLRYWGFNTETGTFGFCVATATNDDCSNALYICDINGYSASTSPAFTPDRPDNMHGNNEDITGTNFPNGTNSGGPFGYYPPSNVPGPYSSPAIDVNIENNSWIRFTAANTTVTLTVNISDCFVGAYPAGGVQMQIFSASNCTNFAPISNFEENSSGFVISASGLTIGNDYILMIDGYAGDICNYTISANSGVQFPDIPAPAPICAGDSVTLTVPAGATSYEWFHDGSTSQSVTVAPGSTQTYYCEVTGLCNHKQTLSVEVQIKPSPLIEFNVANDSSICMSETVTITASGADTYTWNTAANAASITVSPTSQTTYIATGTVNGCVGTNSVTIQVDALPVISGTANASPSNCGGSTGSISGLTANTASEISWVNASGVEIGTSMIVSNLPAGSYTLTVSDINQCVSSYGPVNIINPGAPAPPTTSISESVVCDGESADFVATGPAGASYEWTGPNGIASLDSTFSITNISPSDTGSYCATVTVAGCQSLPSCVSLGLFPKPQITINGGANNVIACENGSATLTASGGNSYSWSGPNSFTSSSNSAQINPISTLNDGNYFVTGVDANGCANSDTITLIMQNNPDISIHADSTVTAYCNQSNVLLTASGAAFYTWSGPGLATSQGDSLTINPLQESNQGWYFVTGSDSLGCYSKDSVELKVYELNLALSPANDSVICPGETIHFSANGDAGNYSWFGPQGFITNNAEFSLTDIVMENAGWYYVSLIDSNNCAISDSVYLSVETDVSCLIIPDLITPDGDGKNDKWEIPGLESFSNVSVEIYNRWGNLIFKTDDYQNNWYGEVNHGSTIGKSGKVPTGTYFYILTLHDSKNTPPFKGYIEVQY